MKNLKLYVLFALAFALFGATGCDDDDTIIEEPTVTVVDVIVDSPDHNTLEAAVIAAELDDDLSGAGPFTVFAPTDAAFDALPAGTVDALLQDPTGDLAQILLYHVLGAEVLSTDLSNGQMATTLQGQDITVAINNGNVFINDAQVTVADVEADNGVVHIIDAVLSPAPEATSIVDVAMGTDDLSSLVAAVQAAGLVETLQQAGPFTVFAPTNAAFQALLDTNPDWNALGDIPVDVLTNVLLFHVLDGEVRAADLSDTYVPTLSPAVDGDLISLQVGVTDGVTFNGTATPLSTDIEASNGVIHIIDEVMLPPSIVGVASQNSSFSTLVAALTDSRHTTDFVSILSGAGPFTVFAPTNAAFQALLDTNPNWNGLGDIPIETLEAVLLYHVVNGANVQSNELTDGQEVTTFGGGTLTVDLSSGAQLNTTGGQTVDIIIVDVQGTNGVVHAVDQVLLP